MINEKLLDVVLGEMIQDGLGQNFVEDARRLALASDGAYEMILKWRSATDHEREFIENEIWVMSKPDLQEGQGS